MPGRSPGAPGIPGAAQRPEGSGGRPDLAPQAAIRDPTINRVPKLSPDAVASASAVALQDQLLFGRRHRDRRCRCHFENSASGNSVLRPDGTLPTLPITNQFLWSPEIVSVLADRRHARPGARTGDAAAAVERAPGASRRRARPRTGRDHRRPLVAARHGATRATSTRRGADRRAATLASRLPTHGSTPRPDQRPLGRRLKARR
jgi:hypothetical protein